MPPESAQIVPTDLAPVIGPQFLGALFNAILFGILSSQVYTYYMAFPEDGIRLKALVYGLYVLETAQTALIMQTAFRMYVTSFGNFHSLDLVDTTWLSVPIMTTVGTFFAQLFYAHRLYTLSKSKAVPALVVLLACTQIAAGIVTGVLVKQSPYLSPVNFRSSVHIALGVWHSGSALCDVIIAASMAYYLSGFHTTVTRTRRLVQKIIRLTIETGSLTAMLAIAALVLSLLPDNAANYYAVILVFGKIYANSMMVLINRRAQWNSEDSKKWISSASLLGTDHTRTAPTELATAMA
ncbi:hypothetical protein NLJ89_g9074 [Agrocybe chaxingu]|uniref:DUF6534 domain-containing protein n=1 Tax=Agrocybe chaxingu TaxID=84603 RepID=A0A9W8JWF5_9AGAR|nr:hypothetical protein NLJ89_g9074 [Agrocybe chaxingu]